MKKTIVILLTFAIALSFLSVNVFASWYYYYSSDIDSFVKDFRTVFQGEKVKYLNINEGETQIIIPIAKSENLTLVTIVEFYGDSIECTYKSSEKSAWDVSFLRSKEAWERCANDYARRKGYELIDDSIIHVKSTYGDDWLFLYGDYAINVRVPRNVVISDPEELNELFELHIYDLASDKVYDTNQFYVPDGASVEIPDLSTMSNEVEPPDTDPDPTPPVDETPDEPVDDKTPSWKAPLNVGSCAAAVAVAALGTLVVVKKKKSK